MARTCAHITRGSLRRSGLRRHPLHVAVMAFVEEPGEPVARPGGDFGPRHRDGIEAERRGGRRPGRI